MVGSIDVLFIPELIDWLRFGSVRQPAQGSWKRQSNVTRILALPERLPLRIFRAVEDLGQISWRIEGREALEVQEVGRGGADKRRMSLSGDMRNAFEQRHVFRMLPEFVVAYQRAKRSSAEYAVLFFVDLLEQSALIEFRSLLDVAKKFLLGCVQHPDLEADAGLAVVHQVLQPAPGALELLKRRVVQDFVQLEREQVIDLRDARIDHHFRIFGDGHRSIKYLGHEFLHQIFAALPG